ncbi:I78 family peptidase inhibitor [Yoonia sp. GPGPB17]|uniref:I78 family peptidase inhibitor n=1 Tax=Yoonia sp. GPGPB17 TaxID=3026147 RepID=UPI0030C33192
MKRIIALIALAGCTVTQPPLPPQLEDTCGAKEFTDLIGQDATALETTLLLGPVRVIRPGDMVTMDFRPDRVNFKIDENETIQAIDCG